MALKDSVEKLKQTRDKVRGDFEETREKIKELRPHPLRRAIDQRVTRVRPLKRIRKRLSQVGSEPSGTDSS